MAPYSPRALYRNYNLIYAERNNGLVSENKAGYDAATLMTYVPNRKGRLLLYYGTADNNVHNLPATDRGPAAGQQIL